MSQKEKRKYHKKKKNSRLTYQIAKAMKVADLREKMRERGMNTKGSKKTLLNRLKTNLWQRKISRQNEHPSLSIPKSDDLREIISKHSNPAPTDREEEKRMKIVSEMAEKSFKPPHRFNKDFNAIWIIDEKRKDRQGITDEEEKMGCYDPYETIHDLLSDLDNEHGIKIEKNDIIYLYPGKHAIMPLLKELKHNHIKGIGEDVIVTADLDPFPFNIIVKNLYFENITFQVKYEKMMDADLNQESIDSIGESEDSNQNSRRCYIKARSLWMKNCLLCSDGGCAIQGTAGNYGFLNCKFVGFSDAIRIIIGNEFREVTTNTSITVIGCDFANCGQPMGEEEITEEPDGCIVIDPGLNIENAGTVDILKCIGNRFIDNLCLAIAEINRGQKRIVGRRHVDLQHNILVGYNAAKVRGQASRKHANNIYLKGKIKRNEEDDKSASI